MGNWDEAMRPILSEKEKKKLYRKAKEDLRKEQERLQEMAKKISGEIK